MRASSSNSTNAEFAESHEVSPTELPTEIAIDFETPLQIRMVKVRVLDENGEDHAIGAPIIQPNRKRISVHVNRLRVGYFVVEWGVVGTDGAHMQGRYTFRIGRAEILSER